MFEAREVSVTVGPKKLLNDVSINVNAGEVVALLGANGAGKSTLLKSLCGDTKLSGGEIRLEDRGLEDWNHYELARKRAVLSQNPTFNFPFTALEVALLGRNPHVQRKESKRDLEIVSEALNLVEATHLTHQTFPTLSGGEQQRIHLARILAQIWEPPAVGARYLLLDEPTASLDLAHQHLTLRVAERLSREKVGVLVVLHDLNLAAAYADRIYLLKNGRIIQTVNVRETLTAESIKEVFDFDVSIIEHNGTSLIVPQTGYKTLKAAV